jgi:ABC-type branched-subunit amino acid transport system substrate-binding protein
MNKVIVLIVLTALAALSLGACAPAPTPAPTPAPPTAAPQPTAVPPTATTAATAVPPTAAPTKPPIRTKANAGETVTFYHFGDITGPYAGITTPLVTGFNDAVKWLNGKGGIRGAKINVEWSDTGGKLENAIAVYNRFREKKPLVLLMYGSTELEALRDRLTEDKIPSLSAGVSGKGLYPPGYAFGEAPLYSDQFGLFVDWLTANWAKVQPAKGQALDSPKIAIDRKSVV